MPRILDSAWQATRLVPPRIACGLPVAVTHDVARGRESADAFLSQSARLPAYQKVLELDGGKQASDVALIGGEDDVSRRLEQLAKLGATDFNAVLFPVKGDPECVRRTTAFLANYASESRSSATEFMQ